MFRSKFQSSLFRNEIKIPEFLNILPLILHRNLKCKKPLLWRPHLVRILKTHCELGAYFWLEKNFDSREYYSLSLVSSDGLGNS